MCLVAACRSPSVLTALSQNFLAGFEGSLRGEEKRGEKEGKEEKENKQRDGRDGRKHPHEINFWLQSFSLVTVLRRRNMLLYIITL